MRILRIAQKVYPDVTGGGPYHVHAMSRDQAAMGHDVTVLTIGDGPRQEQRDGYTVVRRPSIAQPLGNAVAPGVVRFLQSADGYDVIHAHSHLYASTNLAAVARKFVETPLAVTNHGLYSQTAPEWVFDAYLKTLGRWTFNSADVVFCYTDADRQRLRDRGVDAPIDVVSNGIDTQRFTPEGPHHDAISGDPAILFVGRLVEGKRPRDAVSALAELSERRPGARLSVVGDGPLDTAVREQAEASGVRDAVSLVGQLEYDEMPAVYRAADALLLPSRAEGLPRTVLEALACDVPVVTSDLPQVAAAVDGVGETVEVGDVSGFAAALDRVLLGTDQPPRTGIKGFDWRETVEATTESLEQLVD